jgi:hypothetical protein
MCKRAPYVLSIVVALGAACEGCLLPVGSQDCEIARGLLAAEDGRKGVACTMNVLVQPFAASHPDEIAKRPIPLSPRSVKTGMTFHYRTYAPSAKLNVTIDCDGYRPYMSQAFVREQGTLCGPTIDLGTVTVERVAEEAHQ